MALPKPEQRARESRKRIAATFAKMGAASLALGAGLGAGLFALAKAASSAQEAANAANVEFERVRISSMRSLKIAPRQSAWQRPTSCKYRRRWVRFLGTMASRQRMLPTRRLS